MSICLQVDRRRVVVLQYVMRHWHANAKGCLRRGGQRHQAQCAYLVSALCVSHMCNERWSPHRRRLFTKQSLLDQVASCPFSLTVCSFSSPAAFHLFCVVAICVCVCFCDTSDSRRCVPQQKATADRRVQRDGVSQVGGANRLVGGKSCVLNSCACVRYLFVSLCDSMRVCSCPCE